MSCVVEEVPPFVDEWRQVQPESLPDQWRYYQPLIQDALSCGEGSYDERDVLAHLLSGRWALLAVDVDAKVAAICVLEVIDFPRQRKLLVRYVAGDGDLIRGGVPVIETLARSCKCDVIEAYARKGWTRSLTDWTSRYVILQKKMDKRYDA